MRKVFLLIAVLMVSLTLAACNNTPAGNQTFTLEELAQYNGQNGAKAYIAVDGVVYDVTKADGWNNGSHQGMLLAGTDATAVFATSPHSAATLNELPKVGTLVSNTASVNTPNSYLPVFTLNDLANYTGANGSLAYIAVDGVVYDVTNVFSNGKHQGMQLGGTDATAIFAQSPHSQSLLNSLPVVGSLEGFDPITDSNATDTTYYPVISMATVEANTGANGSTAYIVVGGVVYDVTNVFTNGKHQGMQLGGTDATTIFAQSPHSQSLLNSLPIVGTLEGAPLLPNTQNPTTPGSGDDDDDDYDDEDEYEDDDVAYANLPQAIQDYIEAHYANLTIHEIELEHGYYEIEFSNDTELKFDLNGQFISVEYDD